MSTRPLLLARCATRIAGSAVATLALWTFAPLAIGWAPVVITSGSMEPGVRAGDIVVIEPIDATTTTLDVGDVITYRQPGLERLVTHRVHALADDGTYRTKGDANAQPDSDPLPPVAVEGRARLLVPYAGLVASNPMARPVLLVGILVVLSRRLRRRPLPRAAITSAPPARRSRRTGTAAAAPGVPTTVVAPEPSSHGPVGVTEAATTTGAVPWTAGARPRRLRRRRPITVATKPSDVAPTPPNATPLWTAGVRQRRTVARQRRSVAAGVAACLASIVVPVAAVSAFTGHTPRSSEFSALVIQPPSAVTATSSCDAAGAPLVTVEWSLSATAGVDGYTILRSDAGAPYEPLATTGASDTSVTDSQVVDGNYSYVARATEDTWSSQDGGPAAVTVSPCP